MAGPARRERKQRLVMDRITAVRRALAAVFLAALLLVPPAGAEAPPATPPPPPAAGAPDAEAAPPPQLETLLCSLLCGLCRLFEEGEEGSSIDPFGNC